MKAPQQLPKELVWAGEHLSEVAMTAIADGEEAILPREAFGHLGLCEVCAAGVESAASLSASVSRALSAPLSVENPAQAAQSSSTPLAFPVWGVTVAIAVAALATLLNFGSLYRWMGQMWWTFREGTPLLTRHAAAFLPRAWHVLPMMSLAAAMLLTLVGLSVARLAPRAIER